MEGGAVGHNFERDPPKDHSCQVWCNLVIIQHRICLQTDGHGETIFVAGGIVN